MPWPGRRQAPTSGGLKSLRYGNLILDPAQKQMGPVFPPAPRSPALVSGDLGDRRTRGSFQTALFDPCGSYSAFSAARWSVRTGFHRPAPFAGVRSRQAVGSGLLGKPICPFPSAWRFRDRNSALLFRAFRTASGRSLPPSFCLFQPLVKRPAGCAPLAASAVRQIPTEVFLRRVFQHCCGHRCQANRLRFPFWFQGFPLSSSSSAPRLTTESCAHRVSRASGKLDTYPQCDTLTVDNPACAVDRLAKGDLAIRFGRN